MLNRETPLVNFTEKLKQLDSNLKNNIYLKLESHNPSGSIKDRIINYILSDYKKKGMLNKETTIVCSSSGNTGISVSKYAALHNYKCLIITNTKCSEEKKKIMKAYGSEIKIAEKNYEKEEKKIADKIENSIQINQYQNKLNVEAYVKILGPELKSQLDKIDYIIATGSTGGTITGLAYYFKKILKVNTQIILADPYGSELYNIKKKKSEKDLYKSIIEGGGKSIKTKILDMELIDHVYKISDTDALGMCKFVAKKGYLLGGTSGLNIYCAIKAIKDLNIKNKNIVVICPDAGYRYLSKIY